MSALEEVLDTGSIKHIPTENLIKIAEFVLRKNYFEFIKSIFWQISGNEMQSICMYVCIYIYRMEEDGRTGLSP